MNLEVRGQNLDITMSLEALKRFENLYTTVNLEARGQNLDITMSLEAQTF